jgi:hypothetical protein
MDTSCDVQALCDAWERGSQGAFAKLVTGCFVSRVAGPQDLADALAVAPATVRRWAAGVVVPHQLVQEDVVMLVRERCDRQRS